MTLATQAAEYTNALDMDWFLDENFSNYVEFQSFAPAEHNRLLAREKLPDLTFAGSSTIGSVSSTAEPPLESLIQACSENAEESGVEAVYEPELDTEDKQQEMKV
jgi:hypothetical protein